MSITSYIYGGLSANTISASTIVLENVSTGTTIATLGLDAYGVVTSAATTSASDSYWTSGSSGSYSIKAINDTSIDAAGDYSLATGYSTKALANGSHAEGGNTYTLKYESIVPYYIFGVGYSASTQSVFVYGDITYATSGSLLLYSNSIGNFVEVDFDSTTYISSENYTNVHLTADYNSGMDDSFIENFIAFLSGGQSNLNSYSHAEGQFNVAKGGFSHTEGQGNISIGYGSHTEGQGNISIGSASHTEGSATKSLGNYSHSEGVQTIAGFVGFELVSIVNGLVTLNSSYKDVTSEFSSGELLVVDYNDDSSSYTYSYDTNNVTFSSTTNTEIQLDNTNINVSSGVVVDMQNINSPYATINSSSSHSEGVNSKALGAYSHAEGIQTAAVGLATHTEGRETIANGSYSHAEGFASISSGLTSHAEGTNTSAIGDYSHAEGEYTTAIGQSSHAEGNYTTAIGSFSHSEGSGNISIGDYSHTEGTLTTAVGYSSHAEGDTTQAIGDQSHAGGYNSIASGETSFIHSKNSLVTGARSVVLGGQNITGSTADTVYVPYLNIKNVNSGTSIINLGVDVLGNVVSSTTSSISSYWTSGSSGSFSIKAINDTAIDATGNYAVAEGGNTTASGPFSHAEGSGTTANGIASHAEGFDTTASGINSHAEGESSIASNNSAHAEGRLSTASGFYSHAEGYVGRATGAGSHAEGGFTSSVGLYSHAEGFDTTANGLQSHTEGNQTKAIGDYSHSEGKNTIASGSTSHAEGSGTTTIGISSHAEGAQTTAIGIYSHAGGSGSTAIGAVSFIQSTNSFVTGDRSVVLGGQNITGSTADTVYVPYLNIKNVNSGTSIINLGVDSSGNVVTGTTGGGGVAKYATDFIFTAYTASTITHNLGSTDVMVQMKDSTGSMIIPDTINNYQTNSVDIMVTISDTYRIIIIG